MLRIGIQKTGRLTERSYELISECGIKFENGTPKLKMPAFNFPMEIMCLRDDDLPDYVEQGVCDLAIVGENVVAESGRKVDLVRRLGFGRCRLAVAVKRDDPYDGVNSLQGRRIATSYPRITQAWLDRNGVQSDVHQISGSVEIAPGIGLADAVCDLVSSGSTLLSNGLREVETVLESEAVLVASPQISPASRELLDKLAFRIDAVQRAKKSKYIALNVPVDKLEDVTRLLPGLKSPSIIPLSDPAWCSLHTVIEEDNFWEILGSLQEHGASGIVVMPMEKMVV